MSYVKGTAYDYGVEACKRGAKAIPCLDTEFNKDVLTGCKVGEGLPYLQEWVEGFTDEYFKEVI